MFSVWMTFAICLVQHTHKSPLSAKAPLCFGLATPKHRQRKIDAWPDSLSLSLSLLYSAQAGLVGFFLATPDGRDQNANEHRPWKLTASTKRCTEGEWKNQSKWKSTKKKIKMNTKSLQQFCNNYLLHKNEKTWCKLTTTKTNWNS